MHQLSAKRRPGETNTHALRRCKDCHLGAGRSCDFEAEE